MYPEDFYYTKDHEWIQIKGDTGTVGITDFAQKQLGDIVYLKLPKIGTQLEFHQTICELESVKAVSNVYSPLSGEVIAVNKELEKDSALINQDPHGKGWIIRLKIKDETEAEKLMSASEYEEFIEGIED